MYSWLSDTLATPEVDEAWENAGANPSARPASIAATTKTLQFKGFA